MRRILGAALAVCGAALACAGSAAAQERAVAAIKQDILALATRFAGQADPDFSKQRQLQPLVDELLAAAPQPPVSERLDRITGVWRQIWGPYEYGGDARGVDPDLATEEIYQAVFAGGYYYNVAPSYRDGPAKRGVRINLLRGEYQLAPGYRDMLAVRFTDFPGFRGRPKGREIWELAALAETDRLPNRTTIVPGFIVKLFFGGGGLREVYTDDTLRITYGEESLDDRSRESLYILERVADL